MRISPVLASNVERSRALWSPRGIGVTIARVDVVRMGGSSAARLTLEPGWTWADCIKPVVQTDSCQLRHVGVAQIGRDAHRARGRNRVEIRAREAYVIEPGHNAWVVGAEPFVGFEFESQSFSHAARRVRRHVLTGVATPEGVKSPPQVAPSADRETTSPCLPSASREARITWARPRCRTHCLRRRPPRHPTPSRMRGGGE